ncbi:Ergosterol biosynthetic protein 28 [Rhynchospora pubera]|uniref:Ergosterol biosynthetic protein 28 n=1 Tax=Rhynchospora pubera TaxID=906938 RepID=A0AAV8FAD9_9POAL|nr:Ergosterol biosynthetic protein 28 [Rhynchospora pubera]
MIPWGPLPSGQKTTWYHDSLDHKLYCFAASLRLLCQYLVGSCTAPVRRFAREREREREMRPLGWWLMLVGSLRLLSVWFGFFNIWALRVAVFSQTEMTDVHGRTFGVWTLLTCTLCFLCAFNLESKPLYMATFLSFIYALGHFLTEHLIYHTMTVSNLSTVAFFAGTSIIWMLLEWNTHDAKRNVKPE